MELLVPNGLEDTLVEAVGRLKGVEDRENFIDTKVVEDHLVYALSNAFANDVFFGLDLDQDWKEAKLDLGACVRDLALVQADTRLSRIAFLLLDSASPEELEECIHDASLVIRMQVLTHRLIKHLEQGMQMVHLLHRGVLILNVLLLVSLDHSFEVGDCVRKLGWSSFPEAAEQLRVFLLQSGR